MRLKDQRYCLLSSILLLVPVPVVLCGVLFFYASSLSVSTKLATNPQPSLRNFRPCRQQQAQLINQKYRYCKNIPVYENGGSTYFKKILVVFSSCDVIESTHIFLSQVICHNGTQRIFHRTGTL
jgi:hypothetical protein